MKEYDPDMRRLATILLIRGLVLLAMGALAVRWPREAIAEAVQYAGGIAVFLGILELGTALAGEALMSIRFFRAGHAVTSITFGFIAGAVATRPIEDGLVLAVLWLGGYAAFLLLLTARLWVYRKVRLALILWVTANVASIAACLVLGSDSRSAILFGGAAYTAVLGIATLVAARWLHRGTWANASRVARPVHVWRG